MFMKVITVSDVYDADRKKIKEGILDCTVTQPSKLGWPKIKPFPSHWIKLWQSVLTQYILPRVRLNPLGR